MNYWFHCISSEFTLLLTPGSQPIHETPPRPNIAFTTTFLNHLLITPGLRVGEHVKEGVATLNSSHLTHPSLCTLKWVVETQDSSKYSLKSCSDPVSNPRPPNHDAALYH